MIHSDEKEMKRLYKTMTGVMAFYFVLILVIMYYVVL